MSQRDINQPVSELAEYHERWRKNRAFIKGRDAVVKGGECFLPKPDVEMKDDEYQAFLKKVPFFPAVNKVMISWKGMIFKDKPDLTGPASITGLEHIVTKSGDSLEVFGKKVVSETLATNFTGILVDHPIGGDGLNAADFIQQGFRPFLALYPAETILELRFGIIRNQQAFTYVRLLETENRVIELSVESGVYTITPWTRDEGKQWVKGATLTPTRDSQPMTEIPFQIVSTEHAKYPTSAPFETMVDMSNDLWILSGDYTQAKQWSLHPVITVANVKPTTDKDGNRTARNYRLGNGYVWEFEGEVNCDVVEFTAKNLEVLDNKISSLSSELARTGSRILADEKAAPEAFETVVQRQEADNSTLAGMVRSMSWFIENALKTMAWWMLDADFNEVRFTMNTDYSVSVIDSAKIQDAISLKQANELTDEEMFHFLSRPGGFIDPVVSYEEHKAKLSQQVADMDGQIAADVTFAQWLKQKGEKTQTEILGSTRAALFRSGKLSLSDMVSGDGSVLTLDQLARLHNLSD